MAYRQILSVGNTKTRKGEKLGVLTGILHLAPGKLSGIQVCGSASVGCLAACLNTAGRGGMTMIQQRRIAKTRWLFDNRSEFMDYLVWSIKAIERKAIRNGMKPAIRLNGTSDLPWEKFWCKVNGVDYRNVFEAFPHIQFYDYTKIAKRAVKWARGEMPENYHLTFSASESNESQCEIVAAAGGNIAVVFDKLPETWWNKPVINGDNSDIRFRDPSGVVVGLTIKGKAKYDDSGFVRRVA